MRVCLMFAAAVAITAAGCGMNRPSLGWDFHIGRASSFYSPVALQQHSGTLSIAPVSSGPSLSPGTAYSPVPLVPEELPVLPAPRIGTTRKRGRLLIADDSCNLEEVCRRLEEIERRLALQGDNLLHKPMPRAVE